MSACKSRPSKLSTALDQFGQGLREGISFYFSPIKAVANDVAKTVKDETIKARRAKAISTADRRNP